MTTSSTTGGGFVGALAGDGEGSIGAGAAGVGAFVGVQELGDRDALLNETMRTYGVVAFLSLLLVLVIAWWQSGLYR